jgi:hypothetical protein
MAPNTIIEVASAIKSSTNENPAFEYKWLVFNVSIRMLPQGYFGT